MINVYANVDKSSRKQYSAINIRHGNAKNGNPFTSFTISDSKKNEDGSWNSEYYTVFVWEYLNIAEKDKIEFNEILALEVKEDEYNGNRTLKRTIFANVSVVGKSQPVGIPNDFIAIENDSDLPF